MGAREVAGSNPARDPHTKPEESQMTHTVTVEVDPTIHSAPPAPGAETLTWAVLDTVHNLIREYAVRVVIDAMRAVSQEEGTAFPDKDEDFLGMFSAPDGPPGYLDLAPGLSEVIEALRVAFTAQVNATFDSAEQGLAIAEMRMDLEEL